MNSRGHRTFPDFLQALNQDQALYDAFFKHLTINVSQFFRDISQWNTLREKTIPLLTAKKNSLKIWSAGCSEGQEPYSFALLLTEYFPSIRFKILATDIDVNVLNHAKKGFYKQSDFASTPPEILHKYFTPIQNGFQIRESLRESITFQKHNLLTDRFDRDFDLIACRNVVIYFTEDAKKIVYGKFVESLRADGILFTGSTEHLFGQQSLGMKSLASFFYTKQL